jgi:hypothetical protein
VYEQNGRNLYNELFSLGVADTLWNLPFVYVYERNDFSVNLVGGVIYPEEIRKALLIKPVTSKLTGKFTMSVTHDKKMNPKLELHVELKRNAEINAKSLPKEIVAVIVSTLLKENSEYASNYAAYGKKIHPKVKLWPYEHPLYFSGRGKQNWVKK